MDRSRKEALKYGVLARGVFQCLGHPNAAATSLCDLGKRFLPMGFISTRRKDAREREDCLLFHSFQQGHAVEGTRAEVEIHG